MVKLIVSFDAKDKKYKCDKKDNGDNLLLEIQTPRSNLIYLSTLSGFDTLKDIGNASFIKSQEYPYIAIVIYEAIGSRGYISITIRFCVHGSFLSQFGHVMIISKKWLKMFRIQLTLMPFSMH